MQEQHPLDPEELAEKFANKDAGKLADLKTLLNYKQMEPLNHHRSKVFEEEELTNRSRLELQLTQRSEKNTLGKKSQVQNDFLRNNSGANIRESTLDNNYSYSADLNRFGSQIIKNPSAIMKTTDYNLSVSNAKGGLGSQTTGFTEPRKENQDGLSFTQLASIGSKSTALAAAPSFNTNTPDVLSKPTPDKTYKTSDITSYQRPFQRHDYREINEVPEENFYPEHGSEPSKTGNDFDEPDQEQEDDFGGYQPTFSQVGKPTTAAPKANIAQKPTATFPDDDDWGEF